MWILALIHRIHKIQFTDHMKPKKEEPCVGASFLLRRGRKILTGGNMEKMCGTETEGKAIQRLPPLGSMPYTVNKPGDYCGYQEVHARRSLI